MLNWLPGNTRASSETGLPFIQNYSPQSIGGDAQNWQILQDKNGLIYSANSLGILQYDGQSWRVIPSPNYSAIRSLGIDTSGIVYFGANGDFGYLSADATGRLQALSIIEHLKPADRQFDRIQDILPTNSGIYFVSRDKLFRYEKKAIRVWHAQTSFLRGFKVNNDVYLLEKDIGLRRMVGDTLQLIPGGEFFADKMVNAIVAFPAGSVKNSFKSSPPLLVATHTDGLYGYDGTTFQPFKTEVDDILRKSRIFHITLLADSSYAIATLKSGVVIISPNGSFIVQIDRRAGLLSNDVKNIFVDREGGMWLGLQTGIARVEYGAPLTYFNEQSGVTGSIGAIIRHRGTLFASSSQGVLYLAPQAKNQPFSIQHTTPVFRFKTVPGITASCWSLLSIGKSLLAATEDGVYEIKNKKAQLLVPPSSHKLMALAIAPSQYERHVVFVGLVDGVALLQHEGNRWMNKGRLFTTSRRIYNIITIKPRELWLETRSDVVIRAKFADNQLLRPTVVKYGPAEGLPVGQEVQLFLSDSTIWAYTSSQMFRFDEQRDRFVPARNYDISFIPGFSYYSFLINGERGSSWMEYNGQKMRVAFRDAAGRLQWLSTPFIKTPHGLIWSFYRDTNGTVWFGGDDVIFRYAPMKPNRPPARFSVLIRRVTSVNGDSTIFGGTFLHQVKATPSLSYRYNALRFECAVPSYSSPEANQYQYFLEGFDKKWSRWTTEAKKDYTNLPEGTYTFRVRARNVFGLEGEPAAFTFIIMPPWYLTWWAYGVYALLIGMVLYGIRKYELNRIRLKDQLQMKRFETEKLKELDQMRSTFFANISHEFRTPLTLIIGQIDGLPQQNLNTEQKQKLKMAIRHTRRLHELVNQLLDVAKLEAGKMVIHKQQANIVPFLKRIFASFESLARQKDLGMHFYTQYEQINVDYEAEKLEKVFGNLLSNAIKFTAEGGEIAMRIKVKLKNRQSWVEIDVQDSGIGIPQNLLPHIFDRFFQVESGTTRRFEGTGIGLALARELVALHSGEICVTSKEGMGTRFTVRLPLGQKVNNGVFTNREDSVKSSGVAGLNGARGVGTGNATQDNLSEEGYLILIVEDNPDMRQYIRENLPENFTITEAANGAYGFEMAKTLIPDLIISDVMMPEMDGYELVRQIRSHQMTSHIPIIMLTAKASEEEKLEGLNSGVDAYIIKPFSIRELQIRVIKLIEMRQQLLQKRQHYAQITDTENTLTAIDAEFLQRLQKIVEENLDDEHFQVGALCLKVGVGERQLYRKLHALLGCTPAAYIRQIRLNHARQLLEKGVGTVSEITFMVGYTNTSAFARAFRDAFGLAPSEYQKKKRDYRKG